MTRLQQDEQAAFEKRKTMSVFLYPSEEGYREKTWQVTTDDTVRIFGAENGWLLVDYDYGSGAKKGRFGYIKDDMLKVGTAAKPLALQNVSATLSVNANATDDPLGRKGSLFRVPKGTQVSLLAYLDEDWAYIETSYKEKTCRVFISKKALSFGD